MRYSRSSTLNLAEHENARSPSCYSDLSCPHENKQIWFSILLFTVFLF